MYSSPRIHRLLPRLTYANVVATIALLVAVGTGSAFALTITGAQIKDNTVTTKDLKNLTVGSRDLATSAVTAAKLATGAVSSAKIIDGTVATADLASKSVTQDKIADSAISPAQLNAILTFKLQNDTTVVEATTDVPVGTTTVPLTVTCLGSAHITGGGANGINPAAALTINASYPVAPNQWTVEVSSSPAQFVTAYAVCI